MATSAKFHGDVAGLVEAIPAPTQHGAARGRVALAVFFGLLLVCMWGLTHVVVFPLKGFVRMPPQVISGDEPHYLMVVNSILFDHDLQLQDDYERVRKGGLEAGVRYAGTTLQHHTMLVNRRTGAHAVWMEVFGQADPVPCASGLPGCLEFAIDRPDFRPSPDVYEVPAHPVAFPAFLALAIAPFHPTMAKVEKDVGLVMVLISWLTALCTYCLCRRLGMARERALLGVLLLVAASSWLAYTRSYYAEPLIGLLLVLALWAAETERPVLAAFLLAGTALMKPGFTVIALGFVLERLWARRWRDALKMILVLAVCGIGNLAFNYRLAGVPVIGGNAHWVPAMNLSWFYETLLDPAHGLFTFVPWAIFAFVSVVLGSRSNDTSSTILRRMAFAGAAYLLLMGTTPFGPGFCYGPRYWVPLMPWMAIAAIQLLRRLGPTMRVTFALFALTSEAVAIPGALAYPMMFSKPVLAPVLTTWRHLSGNSFLPSHGVKSKPLDSKK